MRVVGFPLIQLSVFFTKFISPSIFGRVRLFCVHLFIPIFKQRATVCHFIFSLLFVSFLFAFRFFQPFPVSFTKWFLFALLGTRAYVRTITEPWRSTIRVDFTLIVRNNFIFQRNVLVCCLLCACVCVCRARHFAAPLPAIIIISITVAWQFGTLGFTDYINDGAHNIHIFYFASFFFC